MRTYERLAMLSCILRDVYIDIKWCAEDYLRHSKSGSWDKKRTAQALKCWNLERCIEEERFGRKAPEEIDSGEFVLDEEGQV